MWENTSLETINPLFITSTTHFGKRQSSKNWLFLIGIPFHFEILPIVWRSSIWWYRFFVSSWGKWFSSSMRIPCGLFGTESDKILTILSFAYLRNLVFWNLNGPPTWAGPDLFLFVLVRFNMQVSQDFMFPIQFVIKVGQSFGLWPKKFFSFTASCE